MSWNPLLEPADPGSINPDAIDMVIIPRARDVGDFEVRRALPAAKRQMVGPFIFFDQFGPIEFLHGQGIDVRPHPHIGLGTVTYLLEGSFEHRDSLGNQQMIHPGEVNWMNSGNGITHSERTTKETKMGKSRLYGIQTWLALPEKIEDAAATFEHVAASRLPVIEGDGKRVNLVLGNAYGESVTVNSGTELFYADAILDANTSLPMPDNHEDRGIYILEGSISVAGQVFDAHQMAIFRPGDAITLKAGEHGARLMLLGGETLNGPRYLWWNFVASSKERIEAAKNAWHQGDWEHGRFKLPPGDDREFIPLPE